MTTYTDILLRLREAKGPDRELDSDIAIARGRQGKMTTVIQANDDADVMAINYAPDYTGDLDAALTLMPEGYKLTLSGPWPGSPDEKWLVTVTTRKKFHRGKAPTPALALLIAIFEALAATENERAG